MAKKTRYYEVSDSHPFTWFFPLVVSNKSLREMRRKGELSAKDVSIRPKPKKPPKK